MFTEPLPNNDNGTYRPVDSPLIGHTCRSHNKSQSQSYFTTDSQSASLLWCQVAIRVRDQFSFLLQIFFRQLRDYYFLAPSLTRVWVCHLLLLLGFASSVPLGSESRGIQDHILLSQFLRLSQPGWPVPRIYIPKGQGSPVIPPGTGFPFRCLLRLYSWDILQRLHTDIA
jgi:hypothetical protein